MNIATGVSLNGYRVFCDVVVANEGGFAIRVATRPEGDGVPLAERVWEPPQSSPYFEQDEAERAAYRILRRVKGVGKDGEPLYA
ncbi:hypothetical protein CAL18_14020 [Bordetella genomosp. 7]|uniref:Uncharacterized protein n=1 Tax=Bordetella genomosp. 7 TaxID=1416805 RepID=A0A261R0F1_9BORD|nr:MULTISPECIES: hypothetical protein [Bordetella]OZI18207.1 hypothetical protein CAL19_14255 [Bordetella genomosp. 7]OZI22006.1 hypothetical protein CAL18_14020 [Bordetella genomosp. 7]